jgi:uncharacterized delta-60 repeat protein
MRHDLRRYCPNRQRKGFQGGERYRDEMVQSKNEPSPGTKPTPTPFAYSFSVSRTSIVGLPLAALLLVAVGSAQAKLQPGSLDPLFGREGKVTTDLGSTWAEILALTRQPDGKIVAVGGRSGNPRDTFALARYNPGGSLDRSFGAGGKVTTSSGGGTAFAVALQRDGKILAAGWGWDGTWGFALMRYTRSGVLDKSFGRDGIIQTDFPPGQAQARAVAVQPDGKIVAAGPVYDKQGYYFGIVRYHLDGSLDTTFGNGGRVKTSFGPSPCQAGANDLALQPNGKLVVAGKTSAGCGNSIGAFALARYRRNGSLDPSFGSAGKVQTTFSGGNYAIASDVLIQPDGKIVAAGFDGESGWHTDTADAALARYHSDGSLDRRFGSGGKVVTSLAEPGLFDAFYAVSRQRDGRLVAVGFVNSEERSSDFAIARYKADGALDRTFGKRGRVTTDFGGEPDRKGERADYALAVVLEPGRIVAGGNAHKRGGTGSSFALVRYFSKSPRCAAPVLVGTTIEHARRVIGRTYCSLGRIKWRFSSDVGRRRVISQRPRSHAKRPAGAKVKLVVSKGKRR